MGPAADQTLLDRMRRGDEAAFDTLVDRSYASLSNFAQLYLGAGGDAYETVQLTWRRALDELSGLDRCGSLGVWLTRILVEEARARAGEAARDEPAAEVRSAALEPDELDGIDERPDASELRASLRRAIAALPLGQREVIILRDVEGWTSEEVCDLLDLEGAEERALLHHARSRVRSAAEAFLRESRPTLASAA